MSFIYSVLTISVLEADNVALAETKRVAEGVQELLHAHLLLHQDCLHLSLVAD